MYSNVTTRFALVSTILLGISAIVLGAVLLRDGQVLEKTSIVQEVGEAGEDVPLRVALTIDDLPWVGPLPSGDTEAATAIERIAAVLRVHQVPATGFVVCDRAVQDEEPLHVWKAWGNTLGNHSAAHRDLNQTPVEQWLSDVRRCDQYLKGFGDAYTSYFRFPLLHQGPTPETHARVQAALREMGLQTAHVTIDNSEWILTRAHAQALASGDTALRHELGRAFIRHIVDALRHADQVARRKVGQSVPHVLLLHANTLVEDYLDALLLELRGRGVVFISLEEALSDPVYARPDEYVGPKGLSWLYRMQPVSIEDVQWDDAEAAAIRERFADALRAGDVGASAGRTTGSYVGIRVSEPFDDIFADAATSERMRSLLVMHRGTLVAEAYFNGAGPETAANLKSVTKSLTAALVGVALHNGWIDSVDDPIGRYLPELYETHPEKGGITIRQLLTMSSGLSPVDYGRIQQSSDWVATVVAQSIRREKRGVFVYDTPVLQLLTAVLHSASGMSARELADRELLGPLGGELAYWRVDAQNIELGGNDAYVRPRDLIKLGELYRLGGTVGGQEILPRDFVTNSTTVQIVPATKKINHGTLQVRGYGFLWWLLDLNGEHVYAALGHGGQILLVSPQRELVVLMTSRWPSTSSTEHYHHLTRLLVDRVLPLFPVRP